MSLVPVHLASPTGISAISTGDHTIAMLRSGALVAWGPNDHGELGDGTRRDSPAAVTVAWTLHLNG